MTININGNTLDALSSRHLHSPYSSLLGQYSSLTLLLSHAASLLAVIVERSQADGIARHWCAKLRDLLPRQQYEMKIQAMVGSKAIASERCVPLHLFVPLAAI